MRSVVYAFLSTLGALFRFQLSLASRDRCIATSAGGLQAIRATAACWFGRPYPIDLVVALLGLMAGGTGLRSARNRDRLAAKTLS